MEETSEELPNFSVGIVLLGPHPTSNKNKAEKTRKFHVSQSEDQPQQILAKRHSLGTKKNTNWPLTTFKGKISVFIVVFKFVQPRK